MRSANSSYLLAFRPISCRCELTGTRPLGAPNFWGTSNRDPDTPPGDFMRKVPEVLGEIDALKFEHIYPEPTAPPWTTGYRDPSTLPT